LDAIDHVHQFHDQAKAKGATHGSGTAGPTSMPKRDKSITVQKVHEFQFYPDFEKL